MSSSSSSLVAGEVVIGVDPHKGSWTAAAVTGSARVLDTVRVPVSREGYRRLRRFARRFPAARWAVEGAGGLGAPLVARLAGDGIDAVDVPAKLAARVRMLSTGHGRKSDDADAASVGIAAQHAAALRRAEADQATMTLRTWVEHREDLVKTRTATVNRLHGLLTGLIDGGAPRGLTADTAARLLRPIRPRGGLRAAQRRLAGELTGEIRRLDRRIAAAEAEISTAVTATGSTLTDLCGIGIINAGTILARTGSVRRFGSEAAFASFDGTAPIEVSSGDVVRHRLSRAGDRRLNCVLHVMAITQIRHDTAGRAYYQRKRAEGKSHKEALRCLKRRLSTAVYRRLLADADRRAKTGPGGQPGTTPNSSVAGSTPTADSSDKPLPGPATTHPNNTDTPAP